MSIFSRRRETLARLEAAEQIVDQVKATADAREPHINWLTDFLEKRKNTNGFGTDFEFGVSPQAARRLNQ